MALSSTSPFSEDIAELKLSVFAVIEDNKQKAETIRLAKRALECMQERLQEIETHLAVIRATVADAVDLAEEERKVAEPKDFPFWDEKIKKYQATLDMMGEKK